MSDRFRAGQGNYNGNRVDVYLNTTTMWVHSILLFFIIFLQLVIIAHLPSKTYWFRRILADPSSEVIQDSDILQQEQQQQAVRRPVSRTRNASSLDGFAPNNEGRSLPSPVPVNVPYPVDNNSDDDNDAV